MPAVALAQAGVPSRIRTYDLRIRNPLLYPAELWAHYYIQRFWCEAGLPAGARNILLYHKLGQSLRGATVLFF